MTLRERWISVLHRAATGTRRTRNLLTPVGLAVFAAFAAAFVVAARVADTMLGLPSLLPEGARLPLSIAVMAVGAILTLWSAAHFLTARGTPVPFNPPPTVVTTGPYRHVRNPMLTGVFVLLLGVGLLLGSPSLVLVFLPLFIAFNVWELKHIEEPELVRRLGDAYVAYRNRTPMFLPRFGRRRG
jgi:protein-S-isoprenylcysteine O-methyltransferase Ste14